MKDTREGNNIYNGSIQDESTSSLLLSNPSLEGFHYINRIPRITRSPI